MAAVDPIRDARTLESLKDALREINEKYYVMFMIGIYSGLRVSDILKLQVRDVKYKDEVSVREKKTGKIKRFPINSALKRVLDEYCEDRKLGEYLVPAKDKKPMMKPASRTSAYYALHKAAEQVGLEHIGTHTMRKTFGYWMYQQTDKNVAMLMKIFNHSDPSITLVYIGIQKERIDDAYRRLSFK